MRDDSAIRFVGSEDFRVCRREAGSFLLLWILQTLVMVGGFLVLGYNRTVDQLDFPLGMPTWYLFAAIIPSIVFLVISILMALRMKEINLK